MTDVVDKVTRSRMMSGIRGKNTKPELLVRKALHERGFRYRLHATDLAGKPDLVFPKYRAVIFVHGCYWHGHNCHLFKLPSTNVEFWTDKIENNKLRDAKNINTLVSAGWRVLVLWECALRGKMQTGIFPIVIDDICRWLLASESHFYEISGSGP